MKRTIRRLMAAAVLALMCAGAAWSAFTGEVSGTNVNVRASHSTGAKIVGRLSKPARVDVLDSWGAGKDQWYQVSAANGLSGWMSAQFVARAEAPAPQNGSAQDFAAFPGEVTGTNVNVRASHSTGAKVVGRLSKPARVDVLDSWGAGKDRWYRVSAANGLSGWMSAQFVSRAKDAAPAVRDTRVVRAVELYLAEKDEEAGELFDELIREKTENPIPYQLRRLQLCCPHGTVKLDPDRADRLNEASAVLAEKNGKAAYKAIASLCYREAEKNNVRAQYLIGRMLTLDSTDALSMREGVRWWFMLAARAGYADAKAQLGDAYFGYMSGAVKENETIGIVHYLEAAKKGHVPAMMKAAAWLEGDLGEGETRDGVTEEQIEAALGLYQRAMEAGSGWGAYFAGQMYRDGRGTKKDLKTAFLCFTAGVAKGNGEAAYQLGVMLARGGPDGPSRDMKEAYMWTRLAQLILGEDFFDSEEIFIKAESGMTLAESARKILTDEQVAAAEAAAADMYETIKKDREAPEQK